MWEVEISRSARDRGESSARNDVDGPCCFSCVLETQPCSCGRASWSRHAIHNILHAYLIWIKLYIAVDRSNIGEYRQANKTAAPYYNGVS